MIYSISCTKYFAEKKSICLKTATSRTCRIIATLRDCDLWKRVLKVGDSFSLSLSRATELVLPLTAYLYYHCCKLRVICHLPVIAGVRFITCHLPRPWSLRKKRSLQSPQLLFVNSAWRSFSRSLIFVRQKWTSLSREMTFTLKKGMIKHVYTFKHV